MLISQFEGLDVCLIEIDRKYFIKATVGDNYILYDIKGNLIDFNAEFSRIQYLAVEAWIADREDEIKRAIEKIKKNRPISMIAPLPL